jgi:hypothetical protein
VRVSRGGEEGDYSVLVGKPGKKDKLRRSWEDNIKMEL